MLENFLFSVNVSLPIFLTIGLGYLLRCRKMFSEEFIDRANTFIFNVILPIKLFTDMVAADFTHIVNGKFTAFMLITGLAFYVIFWILGAVVLKNPRKVGAFVHGTVRGNYVYIGFPLIQSILGVTSNPAEAMLASIIIIPLYNVLAVIVLTVTNHPGEKIDFKKIFWQIIKNPMIIGMVAGIPFSLLRSMVGWELPVAITKTLNSVGSMSTPFALIMVGAGTRLGSLKENAFPVALSCFCRLIVQPLIIVPLALLFKMTRTELVVLYVAYSVPAAVNTYIVTRKMGGDSDLGSGIVVMTVIVSLFTMTFGIFLLKTIGLI